VPETPRRSVPDNLDPLVDTLSNVVGILVVVVALTQLQVGEALDRLIELDASKLPGARQFASRVEVEHAELTLRLSEAEKRREAILNRSDGEIADAIAAAERSLERLAKQPSAPRTKRAASLVAIEREIETRKRELEAQGTALDRRSEYAREIERVPKELVARLPDPGIVTGEEAWILCRYARCYLADRSDLVDAGSHAISATIGETRPATAQELESISHHLRKRDIGHGNFRWQLLTQPHPRARLVWRSRDPGIERTRLSTSPELARWLSSRSPERDFIRFKVWNDSFEAYLEARQVIESAGFRAGWDAFDSDDELELALSFGKALPKEGPVEVD
jgi:hypothetical protein